MGYFLAIDPGHADLLPVDPLLVWIFLWLSTVAFRIVTPAAPQRTALKKDGSTNAGAVVQCESLDVENGGHNVPELKT